MANSGGSAQIEGSSGGSTIPANGAEWVELLVREVLLNASNVEDAKARVAQALEALEKSICANATEEAAQSFRKVFCFVNPCQPSPRNHSILI